MTKISKAATSPLAAARPEAVRQIRALEARLQAALEGRSLLGVYNLVRKRDGDAWWGMRVRSKRDGKFAFAGTDRSFLCLSPRGVLVMVNCPGHYDRPVTATPALDDVLLTEDHELFLRTLVEAIGRHLARLCVGDRLSDYGHAFYVLLGEVARQLTEDQPLGLPSIQAVGR